MSITTKQSPYFNHKINQNKKNQACIRRRKRTLDVHRLSVIIGSPNITTGKQIVWNVYFML
jgi:hypothetical protein